MFFLKIKKKAVSNKFYNAPKYNYCFLMEDNLNGNKKVVEMGSNIYWS